MAICRHWKKGYCQHGAQCGYRHPETEPPPERQHSRNVRPPPPPASAYESPPALRLPEPDMSKAQDKKAMVHPDRLALISTSTPPSAPSPDARHEYMEDPENMMFHGGDDGVFKRPARPVGRGREVWHSQAEWPPRSPSPEREASKHHYHRQPTSNYDISASNYNASFPFHAARMGAQKRMSNGEAKAPVGPHPSTIRVSAQYQTQAAIERKLQQPGVDHQERSIAEAKENSLRLQGVQWLEVVRRALQLPVRTFTTACTYFHKFRLAHPPGTPTGDSYIWSDAAAASLLTACKMEDTLKKSREILAASYNLKAISAHDHLPSDDPMFEQQSRVVIGLERMVLEASTFDFRSRSPHHTLTKIAKSLRRAEEEIKPVHDLAWTALTDIYRTFTPLKQTSVTLALAMLELAARLTNANDVLAALQNYDLDKVSTTREEIMETILDSLDLYVQHTTASTLGTRFSLDDFLRLRLALNKECEENSIPRHCTAPAHVASTTKVQNGHPTPVSPPQNGSSTNPPQAPVVLQHAPPVAGGTLRFMLNPQLAHDEREQVDSYFKEEWEEYEEEIEVPLPHIERNRHHNQQQRQSGPPSSRASSREPRSEGRRDDRSDRDRPSRPFDDRRERERARMDRERERDRDYDRDSRRPPPRDRERDRRYDDGDVRRRYDDRDYRRYDERRYDDRRPRDERRYPRDSRR